MARETDTPIEEWQQKENTLLLKANFAHAPHNCEETVSYVETDGDLGQAWYCSICGKLLQVG